MLPDQQFPDAPETERLKASLSVELEREKSKLQTELEQEKHRLTAQREAEARQARHSEVIYLELGQHMRSLNTFLWQVPGLVIAITGGLWFGASSIDNPLAKQIALGYTAAVDLLMIAVVWRMRVLFQRNLNYQLQYEGKTPNGPAAASPLKYVVVWIWTILLGAGAIISICGVFYPELVRRADPPPVTAAQRGSESKQADVKKEPVGAGGGTPSVQESSSATRQVPSVDVQNSGTPPAPTISASAGIRKN